MAVIIKSAADARKAVDSLRSDSSNFLPRIKLSQSLTDPNFGLLVGAGYVDFIISEADTWKSEQNNNYPLWYISAHEFSAALQKCNEIAGDGKELDLSVLFRLRTAILHKLLKPMLCSKIPGVGLATIAPNASSANNVASLISRECVAMGTSAAYTVMDSLSLYPDPAFLEAFCAAGAVEIAAICWYYTSEIGLRNMGTVTIDYLVHATTNKLALESLTKHLSAEMIVGKCKEILREFIGPNPMDAWHRGRMIELLANMCDPTRSDLAIALSNNGVPGVLVEIADHVMKDSKADKELVTKMGGLLAVMFEFLPKTTPGLLATIEHGGALQLMAQVFLDTSFLDGNLESWANVLERITHCASCLDVGCPRLCSDRGAAAVARVLKQDDLWVKTSIALSALVEERAPGPYKYAMKKRLGTWLDVGRAIGLSESMLSNHVVPQASSANGTAKVPRKDEDGCRYGECVRHGRIDEETEWMLLKCSGCKKARYCSRECQSKDWKAGHKSQCRSMKKL